MGHVDFQKLKAFCEAVCRCNPEVAWIAVGDRQGLELVATGRISAPGVRDAPALAESVHAAGNKLMHACDLGSFDTMVMTGTRGYLMVMPLGELGILTVQTAPPPVAFSTIRGDIEWLRLRISELFV